MRYYIKFSFQSLIPRHLTPFDWKFLQIGILRAKDLRKNLSILKQGGLTPVPTTQLVIRVVLQLWSYGVSNPLIPQLYMFYYPFLVFTFFEVCSDCLNLQFRPIRAHFKKSKYYKKLYIMSGAERSEVPASLSKKKIKKSPFYFLNGQFNFYV